MSRILECDHCDVFIEKWGGDEFDRGPNGEGPYCDRCWKLYKEIFSLGEKIEELEKQAKASRWHPKRHSPYDASRRRA